MSTARRDHGHRRARAAGDHGGREPRRADRGSAAPGLADGDILVVTSKIISKAEGRVVSADREDAIAAETVRVVARRGPTTIAQTRHGLVLAAAGVDRSNTAAGTVVLLPDDPDGSARRLRKPIADLTGAQHRRADHRHDGPTVAQRPDRHGDRGGRRAAAARSPRPARHASATCSRSRWPPSPTRSPRAAELVKGKTDQVPVAIVRGLAELVQRQRRTDGETGQARPRWSGRPPRTCSGSAPPTCWPSAGRSARLHRRAGRPGRGAPRDRGGGDRPGAASQPALAVRGRRVAGRQDQAAR